MKVLMKHAFCFIAPGLSNITNDCIKCTLFCSEWFYTKGLELGAVDYITKPICPPVVLARVKNHLILKAVKDAIESNRKILEDEKKLLEIEQLTTKKLMSNILPKPIADRLKRVERIFLGRIPRPRFYLRIWWVLLRCRVNCVRQNS